MVEIPRTVVSRRIPDSLKALNEQGNQHLKNMVVKESGCGCPNCRPIARKQAELLVYARNGINTEQEVDHQLYIHKDYADMQQKSRLDKTKKEIELIKANKKKK